MNYLTRVPTISPDMHAILVRGREPDASERRKMQQQIRAACAAIQRERLRVLKKVGGDGQ